MAIIKELKKTIRFFIPYGIYRKFDEHRGFLKEIIYKTCKFYRNKTENFGVNLMDKNEECVVLASGPSLKETFANKKTYKFIKNKKKFCAGTFVFSKEFYNLKPEYICYMDPAFWSRKLSPKIQKKCNDIYSKLLLVDWQIIIFLPKYAEKWNFVIDLPNNNQNIKIIYINTAESLYKKRSLASLIDYKRNKATPIMQTVAFATIYLPINIGFKNIYLFGLDHSWHENITVRDDNILCIVDKHFYDKKQPKLIPIYTDGTQSNTITIAEGFSAWTRVFEGHLELELYAQFMKKKIYNSGINSYIDAYERKNIGSKNFKII